MALPAMLGLYILSLKKGFDIKYVVLLTFVTLLMSAYNPTLMLINFIVLALFFVFFVVVVDRKKIWSALKFNIIFLLAYFAVSLYWALPLIDYTTTAWWSKIFSESLAMQNIGSSYTEVFRSLGYWGFYSGYRGEAYFPFSGPLLQNPFLIMMSLLIPLFALFAVLIKPKDKIRLFFAFLLIVCIPMAVASYPPDNPYTLGKVYQWAYEHIPFFSVFRDNYKFVMPIALAFSALIGFLVNDLVHPFTLRFPRCLSFGEYLNKLRGVFVVFIISVLLINAWPLLTGNVISQNQTVKEIPPYWYDAADWVNNLPGDGGIFLMPEQYFPIYTWGQKAGDVNVALFNKPQIFEETSSGAYYPYSGDAIAMAYGAIVKNETSYAGKILGLLGVEYILQRNDVDWTFYNVQSPAEVQMLLSQQIGIHFAKSFGQLDFYKNDFYVPMIYSAENGVYIDGSVDSLPIIGVLNNLDVNSSVLFFSSSLSSQNQQILNLVTNVISANENYAKIDVTNHTISSVELSYKMIDPTYYTIDVNSETPFFLVFSQSYQPQWQASINENTIEEHFMANGYANSWYINETGQFKISMRYTAETIYDVGKIISIASIIILALLLVPLKLVRIRFLRKKNIKILEKNELFFERFKQIS